MLQPTKLPNASRGPGNAPLMKLWSTSSMAQTSKIGRDRGGQEGDMSAPYPRRAPGQANSRCYEWAGRGGRKGGRRESFSTP